MNLLLKEDKKYIFNKKSCQFYAEVDTSLYFTNPKAVIKFDEGTEIDCVYSLAEKKQVWTGEPLQNGTLVYQGGSWIIKDYINILN